MSVSLGARSLSLAAPLPPPRLSVGLTRVSPPQLRPREGRPRQRRGGAGGRRLECGGSGGGGGRRRQRQRQKLRAGVRVGAASPVKAAGPGPPPAPPLAAAGPGQGRQSVLSILPGI